MPVLAPSVPVIERLLAARRSLATVLLYAGVLSLVACFLPRTSIAAAESTASCWHRWTDSITPGVTTTPQKVAFTSHGETGTINCTGSVRGQQVTGLGTFGEEGVFEGNCTSGTGSTTFSFTIPTTGGQAKFRLRATFTVAGFGVTSSDVFPGAFVFAPTAGDCLTAPVTQVSIFRIGSLKS